MPIAVPYTTPAPRPAIAYDRYNTVSVSARPLPIQPRPAHRPPIATRSFGPNLSTSHPSNGTSHVSSSTKTVNVTWTAACSTRRCFCSGGTNRVQPYWKFATAIMLRMLKNRISQRFCLMMSDPLENQPGASGERATAPLCRRPVFRQLRSERDHAGNQPLGPHLVDLALEVIEVVVGEVREPPLAQQVVADRRPLQAAFGDVAGLAQQADHALFHFVERPYAAGHRQLAQAVRLHRVVVPALRAWIERVDEGGSADAQRLAHA